MFGWVDHAAALDGFLFRYAVCPLCLSWSVVVCRLSSVVVCRSLALPLLSSAVGAGQALVTPRLPDRVGRTDTVLGRAFVCLPLLWLGGPACSRG